MVRDSSLKFGREARASSDQRHAVCRDPTDARSGPRRRTAHNANGQVPSSLPNAGQTK